MRHSCGDPVWKVSSKVDGGVVGSRWQAARGQSLVHGPRPGTLEILKVRKGTNGVSTNVVTANVMFFDRGTFWVLPLTCFCLPKSARAYIFPQSDKINYFCSAPLVVTPFVRNQHVRLRLRAQVSADPCTMATMGIVSTRGT